MSKILFDNLLLTATLSSVSPNTSYPVTNLAHVFLKKVYKSTTNHDTITMAWTDDQDVDCCYVGYTNGKSFHLRLYDSVGAVLYSETFCDGSMCAQFSEVSGVRSAQLDVNNYDETTVYLGGIGIGALDALPNPLADWEDGYQDNSAFSESDDGQVLSNSIAWLRRLTLNFFVTTYLAYLAIKAKFRDVTRPLFVDIFEGMHEARAPMAIWDASDVPLYPTSPAGTTYIQDEWADVDGWGPTSSSCTVAVINGQLVITPSGALPSATIQRSALTYLNKTFRVSVKYDPAISAIQYYNGTSYISMPMTLVNGYYIADIYPTAAHATIAFLRIASLTTLTATLYVDWIYVGTGAYAADSLPDISGNGQHFTINGATPDGAGNLILDGVNDGLVSTNVLPVMPDVFCPRINFPSGHAQLATAQVLANYKSTSSTVGYFWLYREEASDWLKLLYCTGSASASVLFTSFFTGYSSLPLDILLCINWTNATVTDALGNTLGAYGVRVYRNGTQFGADQAMTTPVKPTAGSYLHFGSYQGTNYFLAGTIGNYIQYFDRLISSAEALAIVSDPNETIDTDLRLMPMYAKVELATKVRGGRRFDFSVNVREAR